MVPLDLTDAVRARMRICRLALDRDADGTLVGQVVMELGDELLDADARARELRLAQLPTKAAPAAAVARRTHRERRVRA